MSYPVFAKQRTLLNPLLILLCLTGLFTLDVSAQEGTKQVMPPESFTGGVPNVPANGTGLLISKDIGQGSFLAAIADSGNAYQENRIYFNIQTASEHFYFGFKAYNRPYNISTPASTTDSVFYKIVAPNGTVVKSGNVTETGTGFGTEGPGWINTYQEAYAGPDIPGGTNTAGYSPVIFNPATEAASQTGNYYIVIYRSADGGITERGNQAQSSAEDISSAPTVLTFFDFTVADGFTPKMGRVYCQKWSFIAYHPDGIAETADLKHNQGSELVSSVGAYYALTTDNVVNKIQFQDGFRPLSFVLAFNDYGVRQDSTDFKESSKSRNQGVNAPNLPDGYRVFLNEPDPDLVAPFVPPSAPVLGSQIFGCPGEYLIPYTIAEAGDVELFIDFNRDGVEDAEDLYLHDYSKPAGTNYLAWNGLDGNGDPVSDALPISIRVTFAAVRGRTNIPLYDAELNINGFEVTPITWNSLPGGPHTVKYYWNDEDLTTYNLQIGCDNGENEYASAGPASNFSYKPQVDGHSWTSLDATSNISSCDDYGNVRTINTWFWGFETSTTTTVVLTFSGCPSVVYANDIDDDDDGIPDEVENSMTGMPGGTVADPFGDPDGDGIPNYIDKDDAGSPYWLDENGDGINDYFSNSTGVNRMWDTDEDGVINELDRDSDNDGIPDIVEAGGIDSDGDGKVDVDGIANGTPGSNIGDSDDDGLFDVYDYIGGAGTFSGTPQNLTTSTWEITLGSGVYKNIFDFDGDGIPNYLDLDSDNDGIPDVMEQGGIDADHDGRYDASAQLYNGVMTKDGDGDGYFDNLDARDGTDPLATGFGTALIITSTFEENEFQGILSESATPVLPIFYRSATDPNRISLIGNADQHGLPNMWDLDSDGDGIPDVTEAGFTDSTGFAGSGTLGYRNGWSRKAQDSLIAWQGHAYYFDGLRNSDSTGRPDYLDIDADDDGITDNIEGQSTQGYINPTGLDSDGDGIDDAYDAVVGGIEANIGGAGIEPVNTEIAKMYVNQDDKPDYIDTDSDGDAFASVINGALDRYFDKDEGVASNDSTTNTVVVIADADEDGLMDQFDGFDLVAHTDDFFISFFGVDGFALNALDFRANVISDSMATGGFTNGNFNGFYGTNMGLSLEDDSATVDNPATNFIREGERDWRFTIVSILPVTLLEFKGAKTANGNLLQWKTATEDNASHFVVEHAAAGGRFTSIGQVATTGSGSAYRFLHTQPAVLNYYRLKMVDIDGKIKYSPVILLRSNGASIVLNTVRPNPVSNRLVASIVLSKEQRVELLLTDMYGRVVRTEGLNGVKGLNDLTLNNLDNLANGTYLLKIRTAEGTVEQKVVKAK